MYKNLLYAIDINKNDKNNIKKAMQIAEAHKANIQVLHVIKPLALNYCYAEMFSAKEIEKEVRTEAEKALQNMLNDYSNISSKIIFGSPTEEILEYAEKNNIDAIILNGHIHNAFGKLGSIADRIVNNPKHDVIILK